MKYADIKTLQTDGSISEPQGDAIIAHYGLKAESNHLLTLLAFLGGLLIASGIVLVISANWVLRSEAITTRRQSALERMQKGLRLGGKPLTRNQAHERR